MKLSIAEGLLLIAFDDTEGRLLADADKGIDNALIGALLMELALLKKVSLKNNTITFHNNSLTGNKLLDLGIKVIEERKNFDAIDFIESYSSGKLRNIKEETTSLLVERGILKKEVTKLLWIPISERMDNANYAFERDIRDTIKSIIMNNITPPPAFVILIVLLASLKILDDIFPQDEEHIDAVKYAKDILKFHYLDPNISETLEAIKNHILHL